MEPREEGVDRLLAADVDPGRSGSSNRRTSGSPARARAMRTRWNCPEERSPIRFLAQLRAEPHAAEHSSDIGPGAFLQREEVRHAQGNVPDVGQPLRDVPDAGALLPGDRPLVRHGPEQRAQEHRLARAVRAQDGQDLSPPHGEGQVEKDDAALERHLQVGDLQDGFVIVGHRRVKSTAEERSLARQRERPRRVTRIPPSSHMPTGLERPTLRAQRPSALRRVSCRDVRGSRCSSVPWVAAEASMWRRRWFALFVCTVGCGGGTVDRFDRVISDRASLPADARGHRPQRSRTGCARRALSGAAR